MSSDYLAHNEHIISTNPLSRFVNGQWSRCWVRAMVKLAMQFAGVQISYKLFHQSRLAVIASTQSAASTFYNSINTTITKMTG